MTTTQHNQEQPGRHWIDSVKTWRYLRLSMVAVIVGLAAAVLYEHFQVKGRDCFQTSISAYYYTPARSVFVVAVTLTVHWITGEKPWSYQTIVVESLLLLLFAVFWVMQTYELRDDGLRQ